MEKQANEKKQNFPELSENEKKLLEVVNKGSVDEVRVLLQEKDVKVDCLDESGMTPLQHAVFRGRTDVAELLMTHGADVNSNYHENGYTALMFAALSGSTETTRLMLKHGAKKDATNTVGRTAAQMAAFVGQHQCVAVINNYFDKEDLEYYTVCRGQEKEPKLPPMVLPALLKLLNMANMHPVKVSMQLQEYPELLTDSYKVCKVLDLICEKAMKSRGEPDEVMGMKTHYLATVIRKAKDAPSLEAWIKTLLRGRDSDGHPEFQDQLIRQSLKEFPYVDSILLQNMVKQLSMTKIGQSPTSLNILNQGINGQKFAFDEEKDCAACGEPNAKTCTACKMVHYCNRNCQKLHFPTHKKFCKQLAEEFKRLEKIKEENSKREEQLKKGEAGKQQKPEQNGQSAESQGAKPKSAKETSGEEAKPPGFLEGFPGASELLNEGGTDSHPDLPDISKLLDDPEIIAAFKDPEISKAFEEVDDDPAKIGKYQDNDKIQDIIHKIPIKLNIVPIGEAGAGGEAGATGGATASGGKKT